MSLAIPGIEGHLESRGDPEVPARFASQLVRAAAAEHGSHAVLSFGDRCLFFKASPFRGRARVRHALRAVLLRQRAPRLSEFDNLLWLRAHQFGAPLPVAAGVVRRAGAPVLQFLFTEEIEAAQRLDELFESGAQALRAATLQRLGFDVGRMHGLGFVHRDLFPRNLLVTTAGGSPSLHFLDAWRGGPGRGLRGPAYDLGCLMLDGTELFSDDEQCLLFEAYLQGRKASGVQVPMQQIVRDAARERTRLAARLGRRRRRKGELPRHAT